MTASRSTSDAINHASGEGVWFMASATFTNVGVVFRPAPFYIRGHG